MILNLEDGSSFEEPDRETIATALARLDGSENGFAVLGSTDMTYIQTSGNPSSGFVIEYQDGSLDEHYGATTDSISLAEVIVAFQEYLAGSDRWKLQFDWEKMDR